MMKKTFAAIILSNIIGCGLLTQATAQEERDLVESPPENPPQILIASSIDADDHLVLVRYKTIYIGFAGESYNERSLAKVLLKDVQILTADGKEISVETARQQIAERDTPILVSSFKAKLPKFYATMFAPATLHFVFPKRAPEWKQIQDPGRPVRK